MIKKLKFFSIILFLLIFNICKAQNIIFDIFGILITISTKEKIISMGVDPTKFKKLFLNFLSNVPLSKDLIKIYESEYTGSLVSNEKIPPLIYLWQANKIDYKTALNLALDYLNQLDKKNYFTSKREKKMLEKALYIAFDFETRKKIYKPIPACIEILKQLYKERKSNKRRHKLFVLSNMDNEMMKFLQQQYPEIFSLFDGIVYSAQIESLKPDKKIYKELLNRYNLNPKETYFIDDQEENIEGAKAVGINSILYKNPSKLAQKLEKLGLISKIEKIL